MKYSLRKKIHKTEYILTLLGSFDTLGLTADLNGQTKSKLDETCFAVNLTSCPSNPLEIIRLKP